MVRRTLGISTTWTTLMSTETMTNCRRRVRGAIVTSWRLARTVRRVILPQISATITKKVGWLLRVIYLLNRNT